MEALGPVLAALGLWLVLAVLLALGIGRAIRLADRHHRDEMFLREVARESSRLADELERGVLQELRTIRSQGAELVEVVPEAAEIVAAAERALAEASAAIRRLADRP
jgi:hypothetical protein